MAKLRCAFEILGSERMEFDNGIFWALRIRDIGGDVSVTNDIEAVVERLKKKGILARERLLYYDSNGHLDEIVRSEGRLSFRSYRRGRMYDGRREALIIPSVESYRITIGVVDGLIEDAWEYSSLKSAKISLANWDGKGDPLGWCYHPSTKRYRPDGNPFLEKRMKR